VISYHKKSGLSRENKTFFFIFLRNEIDCKKKNGYFKILKKIDIKKRKSYNK